MNPTNQVKETKDGWLRVRVKKGQRKKLETVAELQDVDLSDVVRTACNQYLLKFSLRNEQEITRT